MKKSLLVCLCVGLLAASASAQGVTANVGVDTDGDFMAEANEYDPGTGGLTFDVVVSLDASFAMTAWGGAVEAPAGYTVAASQLVYGTWVVNYADNPVVVPPTNSSNWAMTTAEAAQWGVGPLNGVIMSTLPPAGQTATSGFAVTFTVTAPPDWAPGDTISFATGGDAALTIGDANFIDHAAAITPLVMVPEPASALLVLAGLPLLRRRR